MSRLILHIGTHKTGTTTVQTLFARNRAVLERHGIIYPRIGAMAGHHALLADWVELPPAFQVRGGTAPVWRWLDEHHARSARTVFLSSEKFCCGREGARVDMKALRDLAAGFDRVEVLCVLRDQLSLIQSFYIETARHRAPGPFPAFVRGALETGFAGNLWLDYNCLLDHLLSAFAPDAIRIRSFDAMRAHPGGIVGAVLDEMDAGITAEMLEPLAEGAAHVSPEPLEFLVAHALSAPRFPSQAALDLARRVLHERFGDTMRSTLFQPDEIARVRAAFGPCNARLVARLADIAPGFEMPAFPDWEGRTGRDALDRKFWAGLARAAFHDR